MASEAGGATPHTRLARLMDGYLTTQLIYVVAKLGIADLLAARPRTADELAPVVGADRDALWRVLRGLAAEGVMVEDEDGRFSLTDVGACLADGPGSLRGPGLVRGEVYFRAAAGLLPAVVHGGIPFEQAYGQRFFEHLDRHADDLSAFQQSMAGRAQQEAAHIVAAYDFSSIHRLVDVGGGQGVVLEAILGTNPHLSAILFDRPTVVEQVQPRLSAAPYGTRCEFVPGDFFTSVPAGADAYLLVRVLHDWDDDDAARILTTCREAMSPTSRLLIVDTILPRLAHEQPAAIRMDLHMLMLLGARERTLVQFGQLLARTQLRQRQVIPTNSPDGLCVIEAVRG